jgi:hypothetical protein
MMAFNNHVGLFILVPNVLFLGHLIDIQIDAEFPTWHPFCNTLVYSQLSMLFASAMSSDILRS